MLPKSRCLSAVLVLALLAEIGPVQALDQLPSSMVAVTIPGSVNAQILPQAVADAGRLYSFGYVGDGNSHPLSSITNFGGRNSSGWPLSQWQGVIPEAQALSDEIDGLALQQAVDKGATAIDMPYASSPQLSRAVVTTAAISLRCHNSTFNALSNTAPAVWQHGTDASPATGPIQMENCKGTRTGAVAPVAVSASFANGAGGVLDQTARFANTSWYGFATGIHLSNAPRSIELIGNTVSCLNFTYCPGNAFEFVSNATPANSAGNSFSYTLMNNQSLGYRYGFSFQIGASGVMEGINMFSNRAYGGSFMQVTNARSPAYGAPYWNIGKADWQGWGDFLDLTGVSNVSIDDPYLQLDASTLPAGVAAPTQQQFFNFIQSDDIVVRRPKFEVLSNVTYPWRFAYTDTASQTKNIEFDHSFVQTLSTTATAGFYWDANPNAFAMSEHDTFYNAWVSGPPQDVDVGGTQINGSVVQDLGGKVDSRGNIKYSGTAVLNTDAAGTGTLTLPIPSGLCRRVQKYGASNGGGEITTTSFASNFTASSPTSMVVNTGLTAKGQALRLNYDIDCN